ncbi:MAG: septal ring lytic transglycosylase RlpA family protein, partial [Flavobacteriales bacterium]
HGKSNAKASFYHDSFDGRKTSNGERYDKTDFTAAHRTLPFNSLVLVTNKLNNTSVVVRINDRGPFKRSRVIDLSKSAAMKVGMIPFGVVPVQVTSLDVLDIIEIGDGLMVEGECKNPYGKSEQPGNSHILLWTTNNWKHAFYMASQLALERPDDSFLVRAVGSMEERTYQLILAGTADENRIREFKKKGFANATTVEMP